MCALALSALLPAPATAATVVSARPRLLVRVRLEGHPPLDARATTEVLSGARAIWRPYAEVTFDPAGTLRRVADVDQIELVITTRTGQVGQSGGGRGLGWIEFVNGSPSHTITVSTTAAGALMEASSWGGRQLASLPPVVGETFVARALALSVAHEIGHYLLKSTRHTPTGLMRAVVRTTDILQPRFVDRRLDHDEVLRLGRPVPSWSSSTGHPGDGELID